LITVLDAVVSGWHPLLQAEKTTIGSVAPFGWISLVNGLLLALVAMLTLLYARLLSKSPRGFAETWGCGYLAPTPRMQYTASSFAAPLVELLAPILRPYGKHPVLNGPFPEKGRFSTHLPEVVLELLVIPLLRQFEKHTAFMRKMHHGQLHLYILYIFATLFVLMVWAL
jgi:hydrogenase-4 component B